MGQGEPCPARPPSGADGVRRTGHLLATSPGGVSCGRHCTRSPTGSSCWPCPPPTRWWPPPARRPRAGAQGPVPGLVAIVEAREESPLRCPARSAPGHAWRPAAGAAGARRPVRRRWRSPCAGPADDSSPWGGPHRPLTAGDQAELSSAIPTGPGSGRSWSSGRPGAPPNRTSRRRGSMHLTHLVHAHHPPGPAPRAPHQQPAQPGPDLRRERLALRPADD